jgi:hypothetical protein
MGAFVPMLALVALVKKIVDFGKSVTNGDANAIVTQLVAWTAGVLAVVLFAKTDFAASVSFGDWNLAAMNFWTQLTVGLTIASSAGVVTDTLQAVNPADPRVDKKLLPDHAA